MITSEQIKELKQRAETLDRCLDIAAKRSEVEEKQKKTLAPDFWNEPKEAEKFLKELSGIKFWVTEYDKIISELSDLDVLYEFAKETAAAAEEGPARS